MSKEVKRYAERDVYELDKAGSYYCRHVSAMTGEGLHSKSDIAAELGWRDMQIDALLAERDALKEDAERYRWLRQRLVGASFDWDGEGMAVLAFELPDGVSIGADCDKNIDAAMQGEQK